MNYQMNEAEAERRGKELLRRMTLKEKAGQLNQRLYGFSIYHLENGEFILTDEFKNEVKRCGGIGVLYGLLRADPWSGRYFGNGIRGCDAAAAYNMVQHYVITHSRLHIPMLTSSESPHGHQALDGYLLPVNLAVGSTFDPELFERTEKKVGEQLRKEGVHLALVSCLDVLRDPRWGRCEECYGEDPYLASVFAGAAVRGIQSEGVGVVAKHFCAQGETTGGLNGSAARIGERELNEIHLPPAMSVCRENVTAVMAAYNEIDGVNCHANRHLLKDVLETEFGFHGLVMADGGGIDRLDLLTEDSTKSAALALNAGVTVGLWDEAFTHLEEAVQNGLVSEETLDAAVLKVLKLKFQMGLFEKPYLSEDGKRTNKFEEPHFKAFTVSGSQALNVPDESDPGWQLAKEVPVLLKNERNALPLFKDKCRIAVIGPEGNDIYREIGDYSPALLEGTFCTIYQGICSSFPDSDVVFDDGSNVERAVSLAENSEVIILTLGGSSSRFEGVKFENNGAAEQTDEKDSFTDCGEGMDSATLRLPGNQDELVARIRESVGPDKKIVSIITAGRPYIITGVEKYSDALLYVFYPGPWGGLAIGRILAGDVVPGGRLPVSLPRSVGMLPVYYNQKVFRRVMKYHDEKQGAFHEFGEGKGYSELVYSDFIVEQEEITCHVRNTGKWDAVSVIQCYRRPIGSPTVPRVRELIDFVRTTVKAGAEEEITLDLNGKIDYQFSGRNLWEHTGGKFRLYFMDDGKELFQKEITIAEAEHD